MSLLQDIRLNWKSAAAASFTPDAAEIEKAFSDQASAQLQQNAGPLLQAPYLIGFEVVESNAPENTRLVGVHCFKVDNKILLAPSLFINGTIKGQNLLYDEKTKMFTPLDLEWAQYLVSQISRASEGQAVAKSLSAKNPAQAHLYRLAGPPSGFKVASVSRIQDESDRDRAIKLAKEMLATQPSELPDIAHDFFDLAGEKVANLLLEVSESNFAIKDAFYGTRFDERIHSRLDLQKTKVASAAPDSRLRVVKSAKLSQVPVDRREAYLRDGYYIEDRRDEAQKSSMASCVKDASALRQEINNTHFETLAKGYYHALLDTLETEKVVVFPLARNHSADDVARVYVVGETGRSCCLKAKDTLGERLVLTDEIPDSLKTKPVDDIKEGDRFWVIIDGVLKDDPTRRVVGVKKERGLTRITFDYEGVFTYNPGVASDPNNSLLGYDAEILLVNPDREETLLPLASHNVASKAICKSNPFANATVVEFSPNEYKFDWLMPRADGSADNYTVMVHTKVAAAAYLARQLDVDAGEAQDFIASVGRVPVELSIVNTTKGAAAYNATTLTYDPIWTQNYDGNVNVITEESQNFTIPSYSERTPPPQPRLGDAWDPAMGRSMIMSASPMALYEFAQENNIPKLLDHGAVGTLARMFDAGSIVETILPKLRQALDALGRVYFLVIWKPEDFKNLYGDADMRDKESSFLSCFRQLGSLVLDLSKRSSDFLASRGNPASPEQEN